MCDSTVMDRFHIVGFFFLLDDLLLLTEKLLVTHGQQLAFLNEAVILKSPRGPRLGSYSRSTLRCKSTCSTIKVKH